jgi:hypothetical protein
VCLYQGVLIPCQSYHDDYACPDGRVAMLDGDRMTFSTQVHAVKYACVSVVMSHESLSMF